MRIYSGVTFTGRPYGGVSVATRSGSARRSAARPSPMSNRHAFWLGLWYLILGYGFLLFLAAAAINWFWVSAGL